MNQRLFDAPPPGHFVPVVNLIYNGRFVHAGTPMPLAELSKLPENLKKPEYILKHNSSKASAPADPDVPPSNLSNRHAV
jgi:hypothetical protein